MPIRGLLLLALSASLSFCSTELETSGVPTFFDPKYHDDGRDSEGLVAQYTPLESIQSPAYSTYTRLFDALRPAGRYPEEITSNSAAKSAPFGESATITQSQSDIYFSDNGGQRIEAISATDSNYNSPVSVNTNNGGFVKLAAVSEAHSPPKDEYRNIPLLDAGEVVPKASPATYLKMYEAPASLSNDEQYESHSDVPQKYYPGSGWQAVSAEPSPTVPTSSAQVNSYFQSPAQSYVYSSGVQNGGDTSSWAWSSPATTPSTFQVGFAPVEQPKSTPSAFQSGFVPLEQPRSTQSAFQAGFAPLATISSPTLKPFSTFDANVKLRETNRYPVEVEPSVPLRSPTRSPFNSVDTNLREYPLEEVSYKSPPSSYPPPSQHRPLSAFYSAGESPIKFEDVREVEDQPGYKEYGRPVKTFAVSEKEYKAYLSTAQQNSGGFDNPSHASPYYSPAYAYGPVEEAKYNARPESTPYYKPKDTLSSAYKYFAKNRPYASGYGLMKSPTKGEWNWEAQSYGNPYDLMTKGRYKQYKAPKSEPYRTRGNGWSQGAPVMSPMKGYGYKYSTMHHPGTVKDHFPTTPDEMENGPEDFEEQDELDNLEIYDCENRHRCKPEEEDISEQVDLTRKKPRENKFLRNDLFKRLIKNIARKTKRRPLRRPPPPPPPPHLRKKPGKCKGRRCRRPNSRPSSKGEKTKTINIVIKNN